MTRDQFLVEQEGGDTTQQYGCYSDYSYEAMPCVIDTGERHNCVFASEGIEKTQCKNWVAVPVFPTDFSKWENFGRLLELAEMGGIVIRIEFGDLYPGLQKWYVRADSFTDSYINPSSVPNSLSTLIAKALGWKE